MQRDDSSSDITEEQDQFDQNDNDTEYSVNTSVSRSSFSIPPPPPGGHKRSQSQSINFFMPVSQDNTLPPPGVIISAPGPIQPVQPMHSVSVNSVNTLPTPPPGGPPKARGTRYITIHEKGMSKNNSSATLPRLDSRSEHRGSFSISQSERRDSISSNGEPSLNTAPSTTRSRLTRAPSDEISVSRNSPSISVDSDFAFNTMTSPSRSGTMRTSFSVGNTPMVAEKKLCKYPGCRLFISSRHCVSTNAAATMATTPEDNEESTTRPDPTMSDGASAHIAASASFSGNPTDSVRSSTSPLATTSVYCLRHMYKHSIPDVNPTNPKRWAALYEVLTTEESYVASLRNFDLEYIRRLNTLVEMNIPININSDDVSRIFRNLGDIIDVNGQFLDDLRDVYGSKDERAILEAVPLLLQHYAPLFTVYRTYLESYDSASAHASSLMETNQKFAEFVSINNKILRLNLHDYLIMPVQRIPRYLLLLREIMRNIPETDSVTHEYNITVEAIGKIASNINTGLSDQEHEMRLAQFMSKVEQDERYVDLAAPGRRIITEGPLKVRNMDTSSFSRSAVFYFVLFNDMLVYFIERGSFKKTYRMRHILKLESMSVFPSVGPNNKDKDLIIDALNKDGEKKKYHISCGTTENRNAWVSTLMKAIVAHEQLMKNQTTHIKSKKLAAIL